MVKIENPQLEHVMPEEVGIKSSAIQAFIDEINAKGLGLQSFTVVRHDKVCAQCFWKPYAPDIPHVLYSMSKSVTSTAVGFAVDEGLIHLDDPVYTFFPEYSVKSAANRKLTVRMLLTMRSDKLITVADEKGGHDWVHDFFKAPFLLLPDSKFNYISENTFMLSAIITKVTGKSVLDYLDEKMFRPLGIEKPFWETDGKGNNAGGWGLYMKSEDLAKFFLPYLHGGRYKGVQLVPEAWVREATKKQTDSVHGGFIDNMCGYGYQFWQNPVEGTFRADGLFGQRCFFFPQQDAMVVLNSGQSKDYEVMKVFWKHFPACFGADVLQPDASAYAALQKAAEDCSVEELLSAPRREELEKQIAGRTIQCKTNAFTSVLTVSILQMLYEKPGKINEMRFDFDDDGLLFTWKERDYQNTVRAGMDGSYRVSEIAFGRLHLHAYSKAAWTADGRLQLWIRPIETAHVRKFIFDFSGNTVKVKNVSEPKFEALTVYYMVFSGLNVGHTLDSLVQNVVHGVGLPLLEPDFHGRFTD